MKISLKTLKNLAKSLIDDGANIEYTRGICELIADIEAVEETENPTKTWESHGERALEVAKELNVAEEFQIKFYS